MILLFEQRLDFFPHAAVLSSQFAVSFCLFFVSVISSLCLCSQPAHLHTAHPLTNQMRSWCQQQLAAFDFAAPQWPDPGLVHCFCVHAGVLTTHLLLRLKDFLCSDEGKNSATFFECLRCDVFHNQECSGARPLCQEENHTSAWGDFFLQSPIKGAAVHLICKLSGLNTKQEVQLQSTRCEIC